jgi:cobalt-zinc-cadmium efflux system outer membrane protein
VKRALVGVALVAACATTKPDRVRRQVAEDVARRAGVADAIAIRQDARARAAVRERVGDLLAKPLTVDSALVVALLNNRDLQATLEELGVAQAELVQAGLLENPVIGGELVNSTKGNGLGGALALSTSLLSAFLIPAKRRLAKAQLRHAVLTVGGAALALVRDVRVAYAEVQEAAVSRTLQRERVQLAEVADELAAAQREASNLTALDRERVAAALDAERLALVDEEVELVAARERLTRLLGLWGSAAGWTLASETTPLPAAEADLGTLEQRGVAQRLDVSAARVELEGMELALALRRRGLVPHIEVGVGAHNEVGKHEGHEWVLGPSLSIELPIFDPGRADFARLRALVRQAEHRLQQRAIEARSEIREHRERLIAARRKVEYLRETVLPRRVTIGERALEQYNGMLIGAYELFEIRAEQNDTRHQFAEALREYWTARADLELAVGGTLAEPAAPRP